MTPIYVNQYLDKDTASETSWAHRGDPDYYQNEPFIRFRKNEKHGNGGWSTIGLHIRQTPVLGRGYYSHGCIRMRDNDLRMAWKLVTFGPKRLTAANILLDSKIEFDHPYPYDNTKANIVLNLGTEENPQWELDEAKLVRTIEKSVFNVNHPALWEKIEADYKMMEDKKFFMIDDKKILYPIFKD
jgi:hypothetical protein